MITFRKYELRKSEQKFQKVYFINFIIRSWYYCHYCYNFDICNKISYSFWKDCNISFHWCSMWTISSNKVFYDVLNIQNKNYKKYYERLQIFTLLMTSLSKVYETIQLNKMTTRLCVVFFLQKHKQKQKPFQN